MTPSQRAKETLNRIDERVYLEPDEQEAIFDLILQALLSYGDERVEDCAKVGESEPELPGDMPDEMWLAIKNDRDACQESHKITVRGTKRNIITAIRKLKEGDKNV